MTILLLILGALMALGAMLYCIVNDWNLANPMKVAWFWVVGSILCIIAVDVTFLLLTVTAVGAGMILSRGTWP